MFTLMIVDDSNVIRRKIARSCEASRFRVVGQATNGVDAVQQARKLIPQVVTMDLTMPHMDGIECVRRLIQFQPDIRILVVSALSDVATGIEALEKGARGFLCKPFTERQLSDALVELTEGMNV